MIRALFPLAVLCAAAPLAAETPAALVGLYNGSQTEMAAGIDLSADGSFRYGLSYGALDETAEGVWSAEGDKLLLTTKPSVIPPRFAVVDEKPAPSGTLVVKLANPDVLQRVPLLIDVIYSDGQAPESVQVGEDGNVPVEWARRPMIIAPRLPVYPAPLTMVRMPANEGRILTFKFEPNDIGIADFRNETLAIEKGELVLQRYDRTIRFRKAPG